MTYLTPEETRVLRITLGLHETQRRAITQNYLHPYYEAMYAQAVASLEQRGFLRRRESDFKALWGVQKAGTYCATDAGRVAVMDEPWK